jgi:hypothetical protein
VWSHETSQTPYVGPPPSAAAPTPPPPPMPTAPMPTQPPPGWSPAPVPPPPPSSGTRTGTGTGTKIALILLAVLLVVGVAVGAFFGVRALTDDSDDGDATDDISASTSPSASDSEVSESPSESASETTDPSPTDDPTSAPTAIPSMCATGAPEGGKAPGAVLRGGGLEVSKGFMTATESGSESIPASRLIRVPVALLDVLPDPVAVAARTIPRKPLDPSTPDLDPPLVLVDPRSGEGDEVEKSGCGAVAASEVDNAGDQFPASFGAVWALLGSGAVTPPELLESTVATHRAQGLVAVHPRVLASLHVPHHSQSVETLAER